MEEYLKSTEFLDYNTPEVQEIIAEFQTDELTNKEKAVKLYVKVRDGWRYNPYHLTFERNAYKASHVARRTDGHCIEKSLLYVACLRGLGIPARLHLAKVKNHIGVERLLEKFGTNELTPHGMVNVFLNGKWVKASPAFNIELCEKCNVDPLDFDGENDSVFQEFDNEGNLFMDYLADYGHFEDVPVEFIAENFKEHYPHIYENFNEQGFIKL